MPLWRCRPDRKFSSQLAHGGGTQVGKTNQKPGHEEYKKYSLLSYIEPILHDSLVRNFRALGQPWGECGLIGGSPCSTQFEEWSRRAT